MKSILASLLIPTLIFSCRNENQTVEDMSTTSVENSSIKVITLSEVNWQALNPARGDKSPQAGTLWGDRGAQVPTGFLAKFIDGFSSPPHIHNATYKAVVNSGLIHNDDPDAANMWMPTGSFWTQPKGETHITSAKGDTNIALVEIDRGPYLVQPPSEAYDSGERPVNVDPSNIIWLDPPGISISENTPKIAYLWGNPTGDAPYGTFVKFPVGYEGALHSFGSTFHAVVITGKLQHASASDKALVPGSYFSSEGEAMHQLSSAQESVIYINTNGKYKLR
ncbi:MAG: DUF4437 domain-containing protein [Calditrichota bacterium]